MSTETSRTLSTSSTSDVSVVCPRRTSREQPEERPARVIVRPAIDEAHLPGGLSVTAAGPKPLRRPAKLDQQRNPDPLTRHDPALDDDLLIVQHQFQRSRIHGVGGDDRRRTSTDIIRTSLTTSFRTRTRWRGHHSVSTSSCSSERVTSILARAVCWSLATVPLSCRPQRDRPCRVDPRPGGGVCTD